METTTTVINEGVGFWMAVWLYGSYLVSIVTIVMIVMLYLRVMKYLKLKIKVMEAKS